jgi:hypothetical protein
MGKDTKIGLNLKVTFSAAEGITLLSDTTNKSTKNGLTTTVSSKSGKTGI